MAYTLSQLIPFINLALKERHIYGEVLLENNNTVSVLIEDGDWKHEHLACDSSLLDLFRKYNARINLSMEITKEDGSDCYSAIHYYQLVGQLR